MVINDLWSPWGELYLDHFPPYSVFTTTNVVGVAQNLTLNRGQPSTFLRLSLSLSLSFCPRFSNPCNCKSADAPDSATDLWIVQGPRSKKKSAFYLSWVFCSHKLGWSPVCRIRKFSFLFFFLLLLQRARCQIGAPFSAVGARARERERERERERGGERERDEVCITATYMYVRSRYSRTPACDPHTHTKVGILGGE